MYSVWPTVITNLELPANTPLHPGFIHVAGIALAPGFGKRLLFFVAAYIRREVMQD